MAIRILMWLDKHGWVPADIISTDPYYSSVVISNLGSIKLKCGYHHLTNWGTCSLFCIIGEKKLSPFYDADGNVTLTYGEETYAFPVKSAGYVKLCDDEDLFG